MMRNLGCRIWQTFKSLEKNCAGQDLIEYALMAGFVAVAVVGITPAVASSFATIMSKASSLVVVAGSY